jgi:hypothetical protein
VIRALTLGVIAAAACLGVAALAGLGLMPYLRTRSLPEAKVEWALRYTDTNLIAIGPSYVEMGFNPDVFDAAMKARGRDIHSFNLGIDGLSLPEMQAVVDNLLAKKSCCLKYFIISPCYECLHVAQIPDSARSVSFFDVRHGLAFLRYVFLYQQLPDENTGRLDYVTNVGVAVFRHHSNLGIAANRLGFSQFKGQVSPNLLSASYWKARPRGFEPVDHAMTDAEASRYEAGLDRFGQERAARIQELSATPEARGGDVVTDRMLDVFLAQVRALQAKGIAVLVVIPPNVRQWNYHAALIARLRRCCAGDIPLVDFGDPDRWRDLFLPSAIRYDDEHMNAKGADLWSRALADQASEWMDDLH